MSKLRVGVVGSGHIGKFHARIYSELPDATLVSIADPNPDRKKIAKKLKVKFTPDYHDLIGRVDAVSIAAPTPLHYQIARDFLAAGIHVLIEKPITTTLEEADELIAMAEERHLVLHTGHIERFNNAWREVSSVLKQPRFIEVHRLGPFQERATTCGVVLDLMIHDLDIILGLVSAPVQHIDSVGIKVLTEFEDLANARIRFENGCVVNVTASRLTPDPQRKIRIFQDDAYISIDYGHQKIKIFTKDGKRIRHKNIRVEKATEPLKRELSHFVSSIRLPSEARIPDHAARQALAMALKITDQVNENFEATLASLAAS